MAKTILELTMTLLLPEILEECRDYTGDDVIRLLKLNGSPALRNVLKSVFDPNITFDVVLPEKWIPDPTPKGLSPNSLFNEAGRLYVFTHQDTEKRRLAGTNAVAPKKKTSLLLNILESVHLTEADLLLRVFKKDLQIPSVTYDVVKQAFPGLLP